MKTDPSGTFLIGTLGYSIREQRKAFDEESWSWIKGESDNEDRASERTVAPFAIDLRDHNRWVAFAPVGHLTERSLANGLEKVIKHAVTEIGKMPTEWNVDPVTSLARVQEWLRRNPRVFLLERTIRFSNPGHDYDEDRRQMRALASGRKTETFAAHRNGELNVDSDAFRGKLEGTETGDLDVVMKARGAYGASEAVFNSRKQSDSRRVSDFGLDLEAGMDVVLLALREYAEGEHPERLV